MSRISGWTRVEDNRKNPDENILILWEFKNGDNLMIYRPQNDKYLIEYEDSKTFETTKSFKKDSLRTALASARDLMIEIADEENQVFVKKFLPETISFTRKELIQSQKIAERKRFKTIAEQTDILVERYFRKTKLAKCEVDISKLHNNIEKMLNKTGYGI